jgi:hypothetical protein
MRLDAFGFGELPRRLIAHAPAEPHPAPSTVASASASSREARENHRALKADPNAQRISHETSVSGRTVTSSNTTRHPAVVSEGQQNTPAAHRGTIPRTTHKSGEYRRIRSRTYCPGAAIRASICGILNKSLAAPAGVFGTNVRRGLCVKPHAKWKSRCLISTKGMERISVSSC